MQPKANKRAAPQVMGWMQFSKNITVAFLLLQSLDALSQTNPTAQSLPYSETFTLAHSSTTYPAGSQGWQIGAAASSSFRTTAPTGDLALNANTGASISTGGIHNYNGKIGMLATGSLDPSICFAVNTTSLSSITVSYDIMTIRNPYDGSSNTRINEVALQYRIGTSGSFITLANMEYQNNTTQQTGSGVTTPQNTISKNITLPAGCNNQSVVQLRLAQRDVSGAGSRPSFAIDNISVTGNASTDIFINTVNTAVTESFNNFLGADATTLPTGWTVSFAGTSNFGGVNTGSSTTGAIYAYGTSSVDYALGALRTGTTGDITITATFRNNTGGTIRNLEISYDFEQWRYSNTSGFTVTTSGAGTGSASMLDQNGVASGTNGTVASTPKSLTLAGLNIPNNNTFTLSWKAVAGSGSNNGIAIDNFSIKADVTLPALYFQSISSGSWQSTGTWQSSTDNSTWGAAGYVPASYANTVYIKNGHTVDLNDNLDVDQVVIEAGGTLVRKASVLFTVNNGTGDDITVYGTLKFQSTTSDNYSNAIAYSSNSNILVKDDGIIEVNISNSTGYSDLAVQSVTDGNVEYEDGGIFKWNPTTSNSFPTVGVTYFPGVSTSVRPVFRLSRVLSLGIGSGTATVINGIFESEVAVTWNGAGTKTFRNGILGTGTITQSSGSGQFIISGDNAELGGTGALALDANGLSIPNGAAVTLVSNKTINSGPISIAGTFDLSDYAISGSYTAFSVSGSATIQTAHLNGLRSASGALQNNSATYDFTVSGTTVVYDHGGAQTVTNNSYYHLVFRGSGDKTLAGNTVVNGDVSWLTGNPVLKCGSNIFEVKGNWSNSLSTDFDRETGTVYLGQASNTRSISNTNSFNILRVLGTVNITGGIQFIYNRLEVPTGSTLNTNGNLTLQSGGSLLHGTGTTLGGGTVSGNVTVRRTGSSGGYIFNYWCSPVSGADVSALGSGLYYYDPTSASDLTETGLRAGWITASGIMTQGMGYISAGGGTVSFTGTAGNAPTGTPITINIKKNVGASNNVPWNLIGNPFPSGLDADLFIDLNGPLGSGAISGGIYFWDDDNSGGAGWATNDYAVWTKAGAVPGLPTASNSGNSPNGHIATGQSFFVNKTADGTSTIEFRNSMRSTTNNVFFRQKPIQRFWVNVTNPDNEINETLIAFIDDATDSVDLLYDAQKLKGNAYISVYTKIGNADFAIQALPDLTTDRVIALGMDAGTGGTHKLRFSYSENLDETVTIVLEDRDLNFFQSLSDNPEYEFQSAAGININRFYLHINPAMRINTVEESCAGADAEISIFQPGSKTWDYQLFDANDKKIASGAAFNGNAIFQGLSAGSYRLHLADQYGFEVSKKITVAGKVKTQAVFSADDLTVQADQPIQFHNASVGAASYEWNFGDGATITGTSEPQHAYSDAGKYTVTLKASNADCDDIASLEITVYKTATGVSNQPEPNISVSTVGENIHVLFDMPIEKRAEVTVHNILGQKMYQEKTPASGNLIIDLRNAPGQYYCLTVKIDDKLFNYKVLLNK